MPASAVYSLLTKKENAHDDQIYCCCWADVILKTNKRTIEENFLVTGGLDSLVKVWRFINNKLELEHTLEGHSMAVVSVTVSSDGYFIASASLDSTLIIWVLTTGDKLHEIETGEIDVRKVRFGPDDEGLLTGGLSGKLSIYDAIHKTLDKELDTRGKFALSLAWSNNAKTIASGSVDGTVCLFDVAQGKLTHTLDAHTETVRSVDFSPDSKLLVTASNDGYVKVFDTANQNQLHALNLKTWILNACFSADGSQIAIATADGPVIIASAKKLEILKTFKEHTEMVTDLRFHSESNKLVSVSKDKSINIYECRSPSKGD